VRNDGSQFWAQSITEPVHDEAGRLRGVVKVIRDETEHKRSEERQSLLMAELNHRVKNTSSQCNPWRIKHSGRQTRGNSSTSSGRGCRGFPAPTIC
jgi:hypothetical protein